MPCWTRNANQKHLPLNFFLLQTFIPPNRNKQEWSLILKFSTNQGFEKRETQRSFADFLVLAQQNHSKEYNRVLVWEVGIIWYKTHFTVFGNKRNTSAKCLKPHACTYHRLCKLEGRIYWRLHNLSSSKGIQKTSIRTVWVIWWLMFNV